MTQIEYFQKNIYITRSTSIDRKFSEMIVEKIVGNDLISSLSLFFE